MSNFKSKAVKKPKRFYDQNTDSLDRITTVGWNDNKGVFVTSNTLCSSPTTFVARYSKPQRKSVKVDQPNLINHYNKNMGRVDGCDKKHQQLLHLHEKQKVVVDAVCVDTRHDNAKLLALVSTEQQEVRRTHT